MFYFTRNISVQFPFISQLIFQTFSSVPVCKLIYFKFHFLLFSVMVLVRIQLCQQFQSEFDFQ